jgi:hypothetical protein
MSNWQLARKPIPFPVRRQCDALASPHGLLFREIGNESFSAQQARDTLGPVWVILDLSALQGLPLRPRNRTNRCAAANRRFGPRADIRVTGEDTQPIGSPAARRAATSASSRAVSRRNWVFSHAAIVKSRRADSRRFAASFALSA